MDDREGRGRPDAPVSTGRGEARAPVLSVIVPVFNEADAVFPFVERLMSILDGLDPATLPGPAGRPLYEIVFIDDGSRDGTDSILRKLATEHACVCVITLARNFGKDAALTAGLDFARGDAVIPIDVDLQDPPEIIAEMVRLWRNGYDMVVARRDERQTDTAAKRISASLFYRFFNLIADTPIPDNVGDYRLMSRPVVDVVRRLRERNRFMKGLFNWPGFKTAVVGYEREAREVGKSRWNFWRLWNFAIDGVAAFSTVPLRLWTYLGLIVAVTSFVFAGFLVVRTLVYGVDVPGYASLMVVVLILGGLNMIALGILGEYIGRIYTESKGRPIYVVRNAEGFDHDQEERWNNPPTASWQMSKTGTGGSSEDAASSGPS